MKHEPKLLETYEQLEQAWLDSYRLLMSPTTTEAERKDLVWKLDTIFQDLQLAMRPLRKQAS